MQDNNFPLKQFLEIPYAQLEEMNLRAKEKQQSVDSKQLEEEYRLYLQKEKKLKAVTLCFTDIEGRFHMLDYDKKYLLDSSDVIIDDGTGRVIDLPGIMGTENSVVTPQTKRILFFIENNNPILIRKTSLRYGIRTMAASINEKHPDPQTTKEAFLRGIQLYQKYAGAKIAGRLIDIYPHPVKSKSINVSINFIKSSSSATWGCFFSVFINLMLSGGTGIS